MGISNRRCACGAVATGRREGGRWVRLEHCRRCLAATRIGDVVRGLTDKRMRYVEGELQLLRKVEVHARAHFAGPELSKMLDDLDTLRSLQAQDARE